MGLAMTRLIVVRVVSYYETQISPLIEEIPIHINTVWLRKVLRDQLPDCGQIGLLFIALVLYILQTICRHSSALITHSYGTGAHIGIREVWDGYGGADAA